MIVELSHGMKNSVPQVVVGDTFRLGIVDSVDGRERMSAAVCDVVPARASVSHRGPETLQPELVGAGFVAQLSVANNKSTSRNDNDNLEVVLAVDIEARRMRCFRVPVVPQFNSKRRLRTGFHGRENVNVVVTGP